MGNDTIAVGVVGVGAMGQHHARVYNELCGAELVGVVDVDTARAEQIAAEHDTEAMTRAELFERVDAVSIAVPTQYHFEHLAAAIEAGVAPFVEKPVIDSLEQADGLRRLVDRTDLPVQVGHIERFNPAVSTLSTIVDDLDVHSIRAQRLGPPPERTIDDSAVLDLMIHDIDVVCSLLDDSPRAIRSLGVDGNCHAAALLEFGDDTMATLIASRKTQRKVRTLEITAEDCLVELDYIDQTIEVHRESVPEYIKENGGVRFTHESIVERPMVHTAEPLRKELASFCTVVREGDEPEVTVEEGLEAVKIAHEIEAHCDGVADEEIDERRKREVFAADD